jgi:hypothetical protein
VLLELVHRLWSSSNRDSAGERGPRFTETTAAARLLEQESRARPREQHHDIEVARSEPIDNPMLGVAELDWQLGERGRGPRNPVLTSNQTFHLATPARFEMGDDSIMKRSTHGMLSMNRVRQMCEQQKGRSGERPEKRIVGC